MVTGHVESSPVAEGANAKSDVKALDNECAYGDDGLFYETYVELLLAAMIGCGAFIGVQMLLGTSKSDSDDGGNLVGGIKSENGMVIFFDAVYEKGSARSSWVSGPSNILVEMVEYDVFVQFCPDDKASNGASNCYGALEAATVGGGTREEDLERRVGVGGEVGKACMDSNAPVVYYPVMHECARISRCHKIPDTLKYRAAHLCQFVTDMEEYRGSAIPRLCRRASRYECELCHRQLCAVHKIDWWSFGLTRYMALCPRCYMNLMNLGPDDNDDGFEGGADFDKEDDEDSDTDSQGGGEPDPAFGMESFDVLWERAIRAGVFGPPEDYEGDPQVRGSYDATRYPCAGLCYPIILLAVIYIDLHWGLHMGKRWRSDVIGDGPTAAERRREAKAIDKGKSKGKAGGKGVLALTQGSS